MIYTLHIKPSSTVPGDQDGRYDALVAIPEALAKWAILAPPIWLARHRLWWELAVYCVLTGIIFSALATAYAPAALFLGGIPGIYLMLEGNQLRRAQLERNGYELVDVVEASSEDVAVARYLNAVPEEAGHGLADTVTMPRLSTRKNAPDDLAFGLFPEGN